MDAAQRFDLNTTVHQAHIASQKLAQLSHPDRNQLLRCLAQILQDRKDDLLEANTIDLEVSRNLAIPTLVLNWLKLTPERLQTLGLMLNQLAATADPLATGALSDCMVASGYAKSHPRGVVAFIYEAFPDLALLLAGMCWKTGNALLLKGGVETQHSNQVVIELLHEALTQVDLPLFGTQSLPCDRNLSITDLVAGDLPIDLVIPYGRPSLVQQVVQHSPLPTLQSAMGNGYLFWSDSGGVDTARSMIVTSHQGFPDAVNAIEKVLLTPNIKQSRLTLLWSSLKEKGFELRGDAALAAEYPELILATKEEWQKPYLQKIVAFRVVDDLADALNWINRHSSHHADCLVTDSYQDSQQFIQGVHSAHVFINTSPQFLRPSSGPGGSPAIGMSSTNSFAPGVISLDTLLTTKQIIQSV
ncbi:gamma-glutamyl-phosphate reductase [Acaryochloris sp. IP29b_bin.148]|uniref:gamma-glutamyl-phosphate reductase n=1 Tax=Acaryochloris sp. IP29b_bin.148 TaxID=2969218 RepID=UPI0026395830|nr:gamma-glutamyl-phosphate reductase [Acaryochloris sp. IP29b_bin.148]